MAITIPMERGPYQDNGASPWFGIVGVGSTGLQMKMALDTGTYLFWVTSTLCTTAACTLPTRVRFDPKTSATFRYVSSRPRKINYGPWGELEAEVGNDTLEFGGISAPNSTFYVATHYDGAKFLEVDWDGCIGFPAMVTANDKSDVSFVFQDIINSGTLGVNPLPCVSFDTDIASSTGSCTLGEMDASKYHGNEWVFLEFSVNSIADYIWTTAHASVSIGTELIATDKFFCVDTGSSRFKGDPAILAAMLEKAQLAYAPVEIMAGRGSDGQTGEIVVTSAEYMQTIEKGENKGLKLPQFHGMKGTDGLVLVGSVLLDHVYSTYLYQQSSDPRTGAHTLQPRGVFLMNKIGGPKIIQNKSDGELNVADLIANPELLEDFLANAANKR